MMDDKKTNIESTEVKGYRELKSYEDYKGLYDYSDNVNSDYENEDYYDGD